jgi:release factor glutamine methyltransferase
MSATINQLRNQLSTVLTPIYGEAESGQMLRMLFEHFCGLSGAALVLQKNDLVTKEQSDNLLEALRQLADQKPIQYILGHAWFCNLRLEVNPSVLIPRPETEELVDLIVSDSKDSFAGIDCRLLDIGTGSGCIAVASKKSLPGWQVSACDISEDALKLARRNAEQAGTGIDFFNADILSWKEWPDQGLFNIIVSNPPYVCEKEKKRMRANVLEHEPGLALFVPDQDPLQFYRAIAGFALQHLAKNGKLFLEINESFGSEIIYLLTSCGFKDVEVRKDFRGKNRFAIARKGYEMTN